MIDVNEAVQAMTSSGGLKIGYDATGNGEPAVLFIHGFFGNGGYFSSQVTHLSKGRRVLTVDLRGHGRSEAPEVVTVSDFAADVIAVCDAAALKSVVLCGHSMGAVVALQVAEARPELVRGIVMLDGAILFPEPVRRHGLETLVPALGTEDWLEALRGYFGRTLDAADPPEVTARVMADLGGTRPKFARTFFSGYFESDFAELLTATDCPLLYLRAKAPTDLQRLAALRPDAMVGQVVGSGHWLMLSVPDQVNAMIDRFLGTLAARRPASAVPRA
jgi:pimeloyl-ACP methyl ester carboxylesterase